MTRVPLVRAVHRSMSPLARRPFVRSAAVVARDRPSARAIITLLLLFLLPVSLLPSTRGFLFRLFPLSRAWWTDNLILVFAGGVCFLRLIGAFSRPISRSTKRWILMPILLLAAWQILSLAWNGRDGVMRSYSLLQSLCMAGAVMGAVLLTSGLSGPTRLRVGRGVTLSIAVITGVYAGLSFVFPSWRPSSSWMDRTTATLGFIRVFGPLGTATTLNFALVPALGFSVGMLARRESIRLFWAGMSLFFVAIIVSTGSRGGLISLSAFTIMLMAALRLRSLAFLVPTGVVLAIVLAVVGMPERFQHLEDRARSATYATALRAYVATPRNMTIGIGHGGLYSAMHDNVFRRIAGKDRWYLLERSSQYGYTLRNSHSMLMRSLVETGPMGLILALTPLLWILGRFVRPRFFRLRDRAAVHAKSMLAGCLALIPYMAVEEFFISAFWIVLLWTMYAVIGTETIHDSHELAASSEYVDAPIA